MNAHEHTDPDGDALTITRDKNLIWVTATRHGVEVTVGPFPARALTDPHSAEPTAPERAVRELHATDPDGNCAHCTRGRIYPIPAPCDTVAALTEAAR